MLLLHDFSPPGDCIGASIIGIVTFSAYFIQHLIDVSSRHFAEALDIPLYNTSIYFSKLYSSRSLSTGLGALFHYVIAFTLGVNAKASSFISLLFMLFTRMVLIMRVSSPYIISVEVYKILNIEAFVLGFFQMTHFKIISRYLFARSIFIDVGRVVVFVIQTFLDMGLKHRPLLMIRIQCWLSLFITLIAVCSWYFYIYHFRKMYPRTKTQDITTKETSQEISDDHNKFRCENFKKYDYRKTLPAPKRTGCRFREYSIEKISLFLLFMVASLVKNFLFPGVLPYAVLDREKCHSVNMVLPMVSLVPPCVMFVFYTKCTESCKKWNWTKDVFWILTVPQFISLIYALYTVHRKVLFTTEFSGSHVTVFLTTSLLMFSYGFIESLAINEYQLVIKTQSESMITYHYIVSTFYSFLFSKLSVGYNCARVEYEYCLTPFYPTYKKGTASSFTFWVRDVIRRAYNDVCGDFRLNIQEYL
ncbi:hypothetical protein MACK_002943 [Theileria orientalis]|uniref:Uncharacterized protein n=1 Tax=Theileria orientalis TaxID=68886 RepID=A0A976MDV5_THEOR|nr:hypothetical protein MACK_002943 [Theileria orientalis]